MHRRFSANRARNMDLHCNSGHTAKQLFDLKDKIDEMSIDDMIKVPKLITRFYTKKHLESSNKLVKKPIHINSGHQDSLLNLNEQIKNIQNILDFENKFGVSIVQKNGQRKLDGRPAGTNGPQPGPGCEIFVGNIPTNIYEDIIYPIFRQVGDIYEMRLMMNFSGSNRGFCFIMYEKPEMAQRAIRELNNYQIRPGWFIGVVESVNNCRLHVTDLPVTTDLKILIKKIWLACEGVDRVSLYTNINNFHSKQVLISFKTHRSAAMARRRLLPESNYFFNKSGVKIEWAHPKISITNVVRINIDASGKKSIKSLALLIIST